MTTKLEQAARQALEALEEIHVGNMTPMAEENWNKAITALREALAEQGCDYCNSDIFAGTKCNNCGRVAEQAEQEPVGYWDGKFSEGGASALYEVPQASAFWYHYENYPLYAAPVRTKDLTDDEIVEIVREVARSSAINRDGSTPHRIARAVIAADREKNK